MSKTVQKVVINVEEIDVFSSTNGVNSVTQLNLEPEENEIEDIFSKFNLNDLIHYPFDMKIVRALSENEEQLKDYLEACRRAKFSNGKISDVENIPDIEYDLRELRTCDCEMAKKIDLYKQAKETKSLFRGARGKISIQMGIIDRAYMEVQELLSSKVASKVLALNAGETMEIKKKRCE